MFQEVSVIEPSEAHSMQASVGSFHPGFFLPSGKLFYNLAFGVPFFDFHVQYIVMDNEDVVTGYQQYQNLF